MQPTGKPNSESLPGLLLLIVTVTVGFVAIVQHLIGFVPPRKSKALSTITDANTWTLMPEVVPPPPGVTGTDGEWSVLLDVTVPSIVSYQKTPFKIVVKRL